MIYAITSKKNGCGRTTVALLTAMLTQSKTNGQVILVDLGCGNDLRSILKLGDSRASLDNLISAISLEKEDIDLESNIIETNGFYLLPGTHVKQARYLEKRYTDLVYLLKEIETKFNSVIIDVDYTLYEELVDGGMEITPVHILDQDMLNVEKYQESIQKQIFEGFYVLNKYDNDIFPQIELFEKNFKQDCLVCVIGDTNLTSVLNRKEDSFIRIKIFPCLLRY